MLMELEEDELTDDDEDEEDLTDDDDEDDLIDDDDLTDDDDDLIDDDDDLTDDDDDLTDDDDFLLELEDLEENCSLETDDDELSIIGKSNMSSFFLFRLSFVFKNQHLGKQSRHHNNDKNNRKR